MANDEMFYGLKSFENAQFECLIREQEIQSAIDKLIPELTAKFSETHPVFIVLMNGAMFFATDLLKRLRFPLEIDHVYLTRYHGKTVASELEWLKKPSIDLSGRTVILLDDILDSGASLKAVRDHCVDAGAMNVYSVVVLNKQFNHSQNQKEFCADFELFKCPDHYVFGYGMDYENRFRELPDIYYFKQTE